jgi:hypothetical protein
VITPPPPRCVVLESPYGSEHPAIIAHNARYAEAAMADSLARGEAPFLGHLLYTRVLDDRNLAQRAAGIAAHLAWVELATAMVVYVDLGVTPGMVKAVAFAMAKHLPIEHRALGGEWAPQSEETPDTKR